MTALSHSQGKGETCLRRGKLTERSEHQVSQAKYQHIRYTFKYLSNVHFCIRHSDCQSTPKGVR